MKALVPGLRPLADPAVPSFAELHRVDGAFFRRGLTGTHREEMTDEAHALFWSRPENVTAMELLGHQS